MLDLNFKFGTFNSLTDEKTALETLQSLSNGDICFATYGEVVSVAEEGDTTIENSIPIAGALFIKMNDNLLPVSLPPGEQGIPLVGQGDSAIPVYTSTVNHLEIGENFETSDKLNYCLTINKRSLFLEEMVFGKKEAISFSPYVTGFGTFYAPEGFDFYIQNQTTPSVQSYFFFDRTYMSITFQDESAYGEYMYFDANKNYIIDAYLYSYNDSSIDTSFQVSNQLHYATNYYDSNSNYITSSFDVGKNIVAVTGTGSIYLETGEDEENCFIQLQSPITKITSSQINLYSKKPQNCSWWNGRDYAMIRLDNTGGGYYPIISGQAKAGSWQIGTCPAENSHADKLIFTYVTDEGYASQSNILNNKEVYTHVKFSKEGVVESTALQSRYYGTGNAEDADLIDVDQLLPGTIYFKIIE